MVTVNEMDFQVKQDAEKPKMSNIAWFYPSGIDWSVSLQQLKDYIPPDTPSVPSGYNLCNLVDATTLIIDYEKHFIFYYGTT